MVKTAVIVLHYKNEDDTQQCLDSLLKDYPSDRPFKLIVVSNQGRGNFCNQLRKNYSKVEVIENRENIGFALANNIGIKCALSLNCEYVVLLNNDTIVGPKLIEKLVSFAQNNARIGLVSPKIYFAHGSEYYKNRYKNSEKGKVIWYAGGILDWSNIYASHRGIDQVDNGQFEKTIDTDFVTGCCLLIKKAVIERIGLLDEKFFLYFEDIDYSLRANHSGFRVVYFPKAHLWHKNASSSGSPGSPIHVYYQTRNRLYLGFKYASWRAKKSLFIDSLRLIAKGDIYFTAVKDYYLGRMGKGNI